jgi:hypothetical protein
MPRDGEYMYPAAPVCDTLKRTSYECIMDFRKIKEPRTALIHVVARVYSRLGSPCASSRSRSSKARLRAAPQR